MDKMRKALFLTMILCLGLGLGCAGDLYAQQAQTPQAPAGEAAVVEDLQEAYGEVVSIDAAAGAITITEYDYEKDEDVNKAYKIDKAAAYENVKSLSEVKVGDWVALTLKTQKDGASLATSVYVERYDIGEESAPPAPTVQTETPEPQVTEAPEQLPAPEPEAAK